MNQPIYATDKETKKTSSKQSIRSSATKRRNAIQLDNAIEEAVARKA